MAHQWGIILFESFNYFNVIFAIVALQSPNLVSRARSRAFLTLIKIIFSISRLHNKCEFVFVYVYGLKIGVRYTYVNYFAKNERKFYGFFDKKIKTL